MTHSVDRDAFVKYSVRQGNLDHPHRCSPVIVAVFGIARRRHGANHTLVGFGLRPCIEASQDIRLTVFFRIEGVAAPHQQKNIEGHFGGLCMDRWKEQRVHVYTKTKPKTKIRLLFFFFFGLATREGRSHTDIIVFVQKKNRRFRFKKKIYTFSKYIQPWGTRCLKKKMTKKKK